MIGIYWANHHSFFRLFVRTDHYFLMLNVFFLMAIAFLPFPTAVLGEYLDDAAQRHAAVTLYSLGLLLPALGWFVVWLYANVRGLVDERLVPDYLRFMTVQYLLSIRPLCRRPHAIVPQRLGRPCDCRGPHPPLPAPAPPPALHFIAFATQAVLASAAETECSSVASVI